MIGIGVDLVEVDRFRVALDRTPGLIDRCFTAAGHLAFHRTPADSAAARIWLPTPTWYAKIK